jgi:predicted aspartyl protease
MKRRLVAMAVMIGLAGCATADPHAPANAGGTCPLVRLAEMPITARSNSLFVQATIDRQPVTLLVDTGAERTLLTESVVKRLELPRDFEHATRTFGIGGPTASWDAKLPTGLVLGGTHFPVDRVSVGRFDIGQSASADGLLGADILLAFDVDLDMRSGEIAFYRARRECPDAAPPWQEAYLPVIGVTTKRDRLLIPFELDGMQGVGVLDTGAQLSSISERLAEQMGLGADDLAADRTVMAQGAAPRQVPVRIHRFHQLRVGPAVIEEPVLPVVPMSAGLGDALVGADFLRGRRLWLSFSTHRVFVTPLGQGPVLAAARTRE